jgi:hypothetical protein
MVGVAIESERLLLLMLFHQMAPLAGAKTYSEIDLLLSKQPAKLAYVYSQQPQGYQTTCTT